MPTSMTTRTKALAVAAVLGVGSIAGAACGDDDDSPTDDGVTDDVIDDGGLTDGLTDDTSDGVDDDLETTTTL